MCSAASNNAEVAAATTIADLQAASKGLQNKGGPDPLTAAMQVITVVVLLIQPPFVFAVPTWSLGLLLLSIGYYYGIVAFT